MKNKIFKSIAVILCVCLFLSLIACGKENKGSAAVLPESNVDLGGVNATVLYSTDCSDWKEIAAESDLFGKSQWSSGDVGIVYISIKNIGDASASFKIAPVLNSSLEGAHFGVVENKNTAYTDTKNAVSEFVEKNIALNESNAYIVTINAKNNATFAVAVYIPEGANGGNCGVGLKITASPLSTASNENSATRQNGRLYVSADIFAIANNNANDLTMTNDDGSFVATISKENLTVGSIATAKVATVSVSDSSSVYKLELSSSASVSILAGFGLENVAVTCDGATIDSTYSAEKGTVNFKAQSGTYTISYADKSNVAGVKVTGTNNMFNNLTDAIYFINSLDSDAPKNIVFTIYGEVFYNVPVGTTISFVSKNANVNSITVAGGNSTAKLIIPSYSAELSSLPYANDSSKILYTNLTLDSEKVDGTKHLDYRGNSDISFKYCVFERAISTRGVLSNVTIDRCEFNAKEYDDTHIGYCYYSIAVNGQTGQITVNFTNNKVTGSWGGINLDWSVANYYVANNVFSGFNCSKSAVQLSNAISAVIENNVFENITDENAIRFYKGYPGRSTIIRNNKFDVDYLLYSDNPNAILNYSEFVFEGNTISSNTNLTLGHITNSGPEMTLAHGYTIDTDLNTIE